MGSWKEKLFHLENQVRSLIEGNVARLFPASQGQADLAACLVSAMSDGVQPGEDGNLLAPDLFILSVEPVHAQILRENQPQFDDLAAILQSSGEQLGLTFCRPPVIKIASDPGLGPNQVRILTQIGPGQLNETSTMLLEPSLKGTQLPENAFLIVNGGQIYPLKYAVINIGRRVDNHLVIDDRRVSRLHAQLRSVWERYVIFDLDSSGGTFVNGERIRQHALRPGDVISLAGVTLIFSQEDPASMDETRGSTRPVET